MHATVIVICMPAMAKLLISCHGRLTQSYSLPWTEGQTPGAPSQERNHRSNDSPRRSPVSRIMDAFGTVTSRLGTKLTENTAVGTLSSQVSLTKTTSTQEGTTGTREGPAVVDQPDAPEYQDYVRYYSNVDERTRKAEDMELHVLGPAEKGR